MLLLTLSVVLATCLLHRNLVHLITLTSGYLCHTFPSWLHTQSILTSYGSVS